MTRSLRHTAYIEVLEQKVMDDLKGIVTLDDLAAEANKKVGHELAQELSRTCTELANALSYSASDEKIQKSQQALRNRCELMLTYLGRDGRIVQTTLALPSATAAHVVDSEEDSDV